MERQEEIELTLKELVDILKDKFNITANDEDIWFYKSGGGETLNEFTQADKYTLRWRKTIEEPTHKSISKNDETKRK